MDIPLTGKPTNQTGVWGGLTSDRAVDGKLYSTEEGQIHCAHPRTSENVPAEWWINLEQIYLIHNVTVYNTGDLGGSFH